MREPLRELLFSDRQQSFRFGLLQNDQSWRGGEAGRTIEWAFVKSSLSNPLSNRGRSHVAPTTQGRSPRFYTSAQLSTALDIVRKDGAEPTVDAVRDVLCSQFEVPRTVRAETLAREIAVLVEVEERQRDEQLLACLKPETVEMVSAKFAELERAALLSIAGEWSRLNEQERARQTSAAQERSMLVGRYAELEEDLKGRDERIAALREVCEAERVRAAELQDERDHLARELAELRAAEGARCEIMNDLARIIDVLKLDDAAINATPGR